MNQLKIYSLDLLIAFIEAHENQLKRMFDAGADRLEYIALFDKFLEGRPLCNWCGRSLPNFDYPIEAMDGTLYWECAECKANPCIGCEYERDGECIMPICVIRDSIKRE